MKLFLSFFISFLLFFPINSFASQKDEVLKGYLDAAALFKESFEYDKAENILKKAIAYDKNSQVSRYLARINFLNANPKKALELFKGIKNKIWLDHLYLGLIYEELGDTEKAVFNYEESLHTKPTSIALFRLGKINFKSREYLKAAEYFQSTIELDASFRIAYYYLGLVLYKLVDFEESYKYLSKAVNFYPKNEKVLEDLRLTKEALGEGFFAQREKEKETRRKAIRPKSYLPKTGLPMVRVGLAEGVRQFSFSCGSEFKISDGKSEFTGKANELYTIISSGENVLLRNYGKDENIKSFSSNIEIESGLTKQGDKFAFYVLDISYGQGQFWQKKIDRIYRGDFEVLKKEKGLTLINILSVEEYLYGVLPAEISHKAGNAAQEAQAVAARTIAYKGMGRHKRSGYDFCADVHCQVYQGMSVEGSEAIKAVDNTRGEVLFYKGEPVEAFYHSTCGGCLRSDAFGKSEYLVEKPDSLKTTSLDESPYMQEQWFFGNIDAFCSDAGGKFRWQRVYDGDDFEFVFGYSLSDIKSIIFKEKGECFHYNNIAVVTKDMNKTLKGDLGIRDYFDKLRSSAFKIDIQYSKDKTPEMIFFWGAGFGHGEGLCQEGAISMAEKKFEYRDILKHYYPKASVKQAY